MSSRPWIGAIALCTGLGCAGAAPSPADTPLRVATFNIQAGGGNLGAIVEVIRGLNADIIGLQEVDVHWSSRSGFADQAAALGAAVGMHVRFAPIYRLPNADPSKPMREFGVAVLSRHPIVEFRNDSITRLSTQDTTVGPIRMPGLLNVLLQIGGHRVRVLATHLDYRADPRVRGRQATEMRDEITRSEHPVLVLGDLNAGPEAAELRPLFERLRDAWSAGTGDGFTYPATAPVKRIDYVLASPEFRVSSAMVVATVAADHRPVIASVWLPRQAPR